MVRVEIWDGRVEELVTCLDKALPPKIMSSSPIPPKSLEIYIEGSNVFTFILLISEFYL